MITIVEYSCSIKIAVTQMTKNTTELNNNGSVMSVNDCNIESYSYGAPKISMDRQNPVCKNTT